MRLTWIAESKIAANYEHNPSDDQPQLLHLASRSRFYHAIVNLATLCYVARTEVWHFQHLEELVLCTGNFRRSVLDSSLVFVSPLLIVKDTAYFWQTHKIQLAALLAEIHFASYKKNDGLSKFDQKKFYSVNAKILTGFIYFQFLCNSTVQWQYS